jgi:hypothetical protein
MARPSSEFAGDGRCLFRALAQGDYLSIFGRNTLSAENEKCRANTLRAAICDKLEHSRGFFEPFICAGSQSFDTYMGEIGASETWGEELEILAAIRVLGRSVKVFGRDETTNNLLLVKEYARLNDEDSPIRLLSNVDIGHYITILLCL